jgi:hypothetical protein
LITLFSGFAVGIKPAAYEGYVVFMFFPHFRMSAFSHFSVSAIDLVPSHCVDCRDGFRPDKSSCGVIHYSTHRSHRLAYLLRWHKHRFPGHSEPELATAI